MRFWCPTGWARFASASTTSSTNFGSSQPARSTRPARVGHGGAWAHDDDHAIGDGHDGATAHDDAHVIGDGHDGSTAHDDGHAWWPTAFAEASSGGELRVWMEDPILVADALLELETQILIVCVWFDWGWVPYSPLLAEFDQVNFLLQPGSVLFVVGA